MFELLFRTTKNILYLLTKNWKVLVFNQNNERSILIKALIICLGEYKCSFCKKAKGSLKDRKDNSKIIVCSCSKDFKII